MVSLKVVRCTPERAPEIADLLLGPAARDPRRRARARDDLATTYFDNPWADPALPSLLCEDSAGVVAGFLGVVPRPMLLDGRPVRAVVSSNLRVRADARGRRDPTVAARLLRALLAGHQDVTFADAANDRSRRLWEACGGSSAPLHSLDWLLPLRPSGALLALEATRRSLPHRRLLSGLGRAADLAGSAVLRRLLRPAPGPRRSAGLAPEAALAVLARAPAARLRAVHDAASLAWIAGMAARKALPGTFRSRLVTEGSDGPIGWYAWLEQRPGAADVLDLAAADGRFGPVLDALVEDAMDRGVRLLRGTVDARHLQAYRDRLCLFSAGRWTLVHARDPALVEPFRRGDVLLQGSDGERWMPEFPESL